MFETLSQLGEGMVGALGVTNLLFLAFGGTLGTILGMLPGIGPATGIAVLLPMTFVMPPDTALITLAGIYYGAMYGGSRSSILLNTPGAGAAVAATFDGYPMTQQGRSESALAMAAIASFIGGIISVIAMTFSALPIARFAVRFGPPEFFVLMIFAFSATVTITRKSPLKGIIALSMGLMISTVGLDPLSGVRRFTFGLPAMQGGIDFLVVIIGVYALGEVFINFEHMEKAKKMVRKSFGRIWVTKDEFKRCIMPILRSTPIGFIIGVLPGSGGTLGSLLAYNTEQQINKNKENFGKGAIEGLASAEAANNAAATGAMIPLLTLGIPGSGTTAVMLGAFMMLGLEPGPLLFDKNPEVVWPLIASIFIGNIFCAILNLPLASLLVRILAVPRKILFPMILGLAFIGTYTLNYSMIDLNILLVFGLLGYFMKKYKIPIAPMILAAIIGGRMEESFRRALMISRGDFTIFFSSTITIVLWALSILSISFPFVTAYLESKKDIKI